MIRAIVEDCAISDVIEDKGILIDCLSYCQQEIRSMLGNDSAASLRDIRRFICLAQTLKDRGHWTIDKVILLTIYCCYSVRIAPFKSLSCDDQCQYKKFHTEISKYLGSEIDILELFDKASKAVLNEGKDNNCIKDEIAINRPLRENVFIMIHCFLASIPVFISGRPGTSKSVAIQVIESILSLKDDIKATSTYFKGMPQAKFTPIWGSDDMTANHIQEIFTHVSEAAKQKKDVLRVIYFEEMGIADCNQNNPLKVLHPLLEPKVLDNYTASRTQSFG